MVLKEVVIRELIQFSHILINYVISFDGQIFQAVASSKYSHDMTALANYRGKALATGCYSYYRYVGQPELAKLNCGIKTELMDMYSLEWSEAPDFPWGKA